MNRRTSRTSSRTTPPQGHIAFLLLEKKDKPNNEHEAVRRHQRSNNVYKAWGSFLRDPVYQWARETNAGFWGSTGMSATSTRNSCCGTRSVPIPIVVTGSANFSEASTNENDENMLVIRGNRASPTSTSPSSTACSTTTTFRAVKESARGKTVTTQPVLDESGKEWVKKYAPGKLRAKRLKVYTSMKRAVTL